jgi:hypothetical protein
LPFSWSITFLDWDNGEEIAPLDRLLTCFFCAVLPVALALVNPKNATMTAVKNNPEKVHIAALLFIASLPWNTLAYKTGQPFFLIAAQE